MEDHNVAILYRSKVTKEVGGMILVQEGDILERCGKPRRFRPELDLKSVHDPMPGPTVQMDLREVDKLTEEYPDEFD